MNPYFRPRRSMLYVPGCSPRYLHKARTLKVDSVILDLGDPILVEAKVESRRNVVDAVLSGGYGQDELERAGAYRVYQDPADVLRHLDEVGVRTPE